MKKNYRYEISLLVVVEKKNKSISKSKKIIVEQNKKLKMNMILQWRSMANEIKI